MVLGLEVFPVEDEAREEAHISLRVNWTSSIPEHDLGVVHPGPGWAQSLPSVDATLGRGAQLEEGQDKTVLSLWPLTSCRNACENGGGTDLR